MVPGSVSCASNGNALWSWHFFVEDRQRWKDFETRPQLAADAVDYVRRWVERPWGLLTTTDVKISLGGSPSDDDLLPLAGPVVPLFTGGYDALRRALRDPAVATEEALLQLVRRRCCLRDLRDPRGIVRYPRTQEMAMAELLVQLVSLWLHELSTVRRSKVVAAGLTPLRDALLTGERWRDLEASRELPQLSRRQHARLDSYLVAPTGVTQSLFELPVDDDLVDRIDVYPPESFGVVSSN